MLDTLRALVIAWSETAYNLLSENSIRLMTIKCNGEVVSYSIEGKPEDHDLIY
jgi:hypothetical protein